MTGALSPTIGRLLQVLRVASDEPGGPWLVDEAVREVETARRLFDASAPAVLRTSRAVEEVLHQVGLAFQALLEGLAALYPYLPPHPPSSPQRLAEVLDSVESRAAGLADMLDRLAVLEAAGDILSPFPTVNGLLKVGVNVLRGHLSRLDVEDVLVPGMAVAERLERHVERFARLHPEAEAALAAAGRSLVGDVQDGLGALQSWLESGSPVALKDGLRLLRHGSENLAAVLEAMDRHVREVATWSIVPALEELWRAVSGGAPRAVVDDALESVDLICAFQHGQARALAAVPLAFYLQEEIDACRLAADRLDAALAVARDRLDEPSLGLLRTAVTESMAARDRVATALLGEMERVAVSPHLEELKELGARLARGATTTEHVKARLVFFIQQHAKLEAFVRAASRDALGGEADELLQLLHFQGQGLEEATRYFRDAEPTHLVAGFRRMEDCLPGLAGIRDRIWTRLRPRRQGPETAACFACGAENPAGQRYCKKCGAPLPHIVRGLVGDTGDEEPAPLMPRNIEKLQELVRRWETDTTCSRDIQYQVGLYMERLNSVRRDFEKRFVPRARAEGSGALLALGREFHENLGTLQEGLRRMSAFADGARPDTLYQGLQDCVDAASALRDAQDRIDEALSEAGALT